METLPETEHESNLRNSGGPLMTYTGQVVGITAIVSGSDGLGFEVSLDTTLSVLQNILG